ncbi:hypothetical protein LINGRAHAP2_LOCUS19542 [Linum grandiflorum]
MHRPELLLFFRDIGRGKWRCSRMSIVVVWLRAGWEAFADFYSLAHCSVLHFTYRGGSEFFVCVYSKSCLEIEYPPPPAVPDSSSTDLEADSVEDSDYQEEEQNIKEEEEDEDDDDEEFE